MPCNDLIRSNEHACKKINENIEELRSMLVIYTGNGKGKTSATIGQAIRGLGQNFRVAFGQFMKRNDQAGEQVVLKKLLEESFYCGGIGFFTKEEERAKHRQAALNVLEWAMERVASVDILILDELIYTYAYGLITQEEVQSLLDLVREKNIHLIISGRNAPDWLVEQAELVTSMQEVKHPFQQGIPAVKGIDF